MFGHDDAFLNTLIKLLRILPVYPMFGRGQTRLQPADVGDIGEAVARLMQRRSRGRSPWSAAGRGSIRYEELLKTIAHAANVQPIPDAHAVCRVARVGWMASSCGAPVTRNQVELMEVDTVVLPGAPGLADLGIEPRPMEEVLESMLRSSR